MEKISLIRRIDSLGRIVIPVEVRRMLDMECGQDVEMVIKDESVILRRFAPGCIFCGKYEDLVSYEGKLVCGDCCRNLSQKKK